MYKIMLADDEGIVIDSLKFIIEKNFGESCQIKSAKTGRGVIELAEEFRPDIAFMDIQMPGINGIEAMKEIKRLNPSTMFIVMSAYDKFVYAKEAINLGVLEYLTKPANQKKIVDVIERAMKLIDQEKEKRSKDLMIKEKLETVVPVIENGMIYSILFQEDYSRETKNFKELLGISGNYGFMMIIQYGDRNEQGDLSNPVGSSVKAQSFYSEFREIVKEFFDAVIGPVMVNQIVLFLPWKEAEMDYDERIQVIERARNMIRKLIRRIESDFRAGIGSVKPLDELALSYKEATAVIQQNGGRVLHIKDTVLEGDYRSDYVLESETLLFTLVKRGDIVRARSEAGSYFDWMKEHAEEYGMDLRAKLFELILRLETEVYSNNMVSYRTRYDGQSLKTMMGNERTEDLKIWFLEKVSEICRNVTMFKESRSNTVISKAQAYIQEHYKKDISLDDISREADISPYYFSKLFKEETGENFIEYLTSVRIEKAKELLANQELTVKEICVEVGYTDPNYFSRIFKKSCGVTPTEFRGEAL